MRTPPLAASALLLVLSACAGGSSASTDPTTSCGDGVRDAAEQCDDGNRANLDGCDASCRFEQVLRANQLTVEFAPSAACTENAFGGAVTSSFAQLLFQSDVNATVQNGWLGLLLSIRGLDDLTGGADPAVEVGVLSARLHPNELMFDNGAQRDVWFMADGETLDGDRVPRARLAGAISGTTLTAGPGPMPLSMTFVGSHMQLLELVNARISFRAGGLSAPAISAEASPGHLPSEHLSSALRSFDEATDGELCGAIRARSLWEAPITPELASYCGYAVGQPFLDLLVGGCGDLSVPTQPDAVDPAAAPVGAGGPYQLLFDAGQGAVTGCQDRTGAPVSLDACLEAAAYSSAFTFAADRVIVKPGCGDGAVGADESCDDGNGLNDDGCGYCAVEPGWTCTGAPSVCTTPCGDGDLDAGEACDDGNRYYGDGCSGTCAVEEGFTCEGVPSVCTGWCGDGLVTGTEECDDGNAFPGDGCSATCTVEYGFSCDYGSPTTCFSFCGDGMVAGGEECDDANGNSGDGCTWCSVDPGAVCTGDPSVCTTTCGDGIVVGAEACDDGNTAPGDGCDPSCAIEVGWTCAGSPSVCTDFCLSCDDGIACTQDSCAAAALTCSNQPVDAYCEDGNPCTVDLCDAGAGCQRTIAPDGRSCLVSEGIAGVCQNGTCLAP